MGTFLRRFGFPLCIILLVVFMTGGVAVAAALEPIARKCSDPALAGLQVHDGFQKSPRCVATEMGAVAAENQNPTLLIVGAPDRLRRGEGFKMKISTRNLVRDRFLAAGAGGYYLESAVLNDQGITRGHIHVACRPVGREAPDSAPAPAFFKAIEDGGGGAGVSRVTVDIPGSAIQGDRVQCAAWAGDGSHRTPMMGRANQIPAFDSVLIEVGRRDRDGRDR
jgi:hypothetical protein